MSLFSNYSSLITYLIAEVATVRTPRGIVLYGCEGSSENLNL